MLGLMSYLQPANVEKVDDYTVKLHLDAPQIGVPEHLFHYPAMIVPKTFEGDIIKQPVGTGPFLLEEYVETERCVLKRRPDYYRQGRTGSRCPTWTSWCMWTWARMNPPASQRYRAVRSTTSTALVARSGRCSRISPS